MISLCDYMGWCFLLIRVEDTNTLELTWKRVFNLEHMISVELTKTKLVADLLEDLRKSRWPVEKTEKMSELWKVTSQ